MTTSIRTAKSLCDSKLASFVKLVSENAVKCGAVAAIIRILEIEDIDGGSDLSNARIAVLIAIAADMGTIMDAKRRRSQFERLELIAASFGFNPKWIWRGVRHGDAIEKILSKYGVDEEKEGTGKGTG